MSVSYSHNKEKISYSQRLKWNKFEQFNNPISLVRVLILKLNFASEPFLLNTQIYIVDP